jgi:hypothetical protein
MIGSLNQIVIGCEIFEKNKIQDLKWCHEQYEHACRCVHFCSAFSSLIPKRKRFNSIFYRFIASYLACFVFEILLSLNIINNACSDWLKLFMNILTQSSLGGDPKCGFLTDPCVATIKNKNNWSRSRIWFYSDWQSAQKNSIKSTNLISLLNILNRPNHLQKF